MATDDVLGEMATVLGVAPLTEQEQQLLLDCTRDVAHGSERRYAPLAAFLLGAAIGSSGEGRTDLAQRVSALLSVLPDDGGDPRAS